MKKILSCFSIALCVILGTVFLSACSSGTKWLRPVFTFEGGDYTIKFIDNTEKDFDFPIEGLKLDHSNFERENLLEYSWVIYYDGEIAGWIDANGGYDIDKNGNYKYGYSTSYSNGVYGYYGTNFCLILKTKQLSAFERLKVTSDYGSVVIADGGTNNPYSATQRYNHLDEEINQVVPDKGSENFVCCFYNIILDSIDAPGIDTINITFSLKAE